MHPVLKASPLYIRKGRWVTMGAVDGEGGTPVYLDDDGTIERGPAGAVGHKPNELSRRKKPASRLHEHLSSVGLSEDERQAKFNEQFTPGEPSEEDRRQQRFNEEHRPGGPASEEDERQAAFNDAQRPGPMSSEDEQQHRFNRENPAPKNQRQPPGEEDARQMAFNDRVEADRPKPSSLVSRISQMLGRKPGASKQPAADTQPTKTPDSAGGPPPKLVSRLGAAASQAVNLIWGRNEAQGPTEPPAKWREQADAAFDRKPQAEVQTSAPKRERLKPHDSDDAVTRLHKNSHARATARAAEHRATEAQARQENSRLGEERRKLEEELAQYGSDPEHSERWGSNARQNVEKLRSDIQRVSGQQSEAIRRLNDAKQSAEKHEAAATEYAARLKKPGGKKPNRKRERQTAAKGILLRSPIYRRKSSDWKEDDHPRDDDGKFGSGSGGRSGHSVYHGPEAPGEDWEHVGTDEHHGNIYRRRHDQAKPSGLLSRISQALGLSTKPAIPKHVPGDHVNVGDLKRMRVADLHAHAGWDPPSTERNRYGGVIFNEEGKVLLREPTDHFGGLHWTFAAGRPEKGDHPVDTALRETEEETGHTGKITGFVPGSHFDGASQGQFFLMESVGHDPAKMDKETADTKWATPEEAAELIAMPGHATAPHRGQNGRESDLAVLKAAVEAHKQTKAGRPAVQATGPQHLADRMKASKAYQEAAEHVERFQSGQWQHLADKTGVSVEEYQQQAAAKAQKLIDDNDLCMRVTVDTLSKILESGRFKNQFETGESQGLYGKEGRIRVEDAGMGVPAAEHNATRPMYGYLTSPGFSSIGEEDDRNGLNMAGRYGAVAFRFKSHVRDRTTVTFGDSYAAVMARGGAQSQATPAREVGHQTADPGWLINCSEDVFDSMGTWREKAGHFIELQYHDGLSVADIDEVSLPMEPDEKLKQSLEQKGVKWTVRNKKA